METEGIRLNKFLSEAGICSRREADRLAEAGKVQIDGKAASVGQKIFPGQSVTVNGRMVAAGADKDAKAGEARAKGDKAKAAKARDIEPDAHRPKKVLLAVHKPRGVVCTTSDKDRAPNIVELVNYPERIYPVGRLDKDSEGLILMTNQGDLVNKIMRSGNAHEKEYLVKVDKTVTEDFIRKMKKGVFLTDLNVTTRSCFAAKAGEKAFRIILTQGLNRQIRRMCGQLGYGVRMLKRVRVMNIELGDLKPGDYRELSKKEYHRLKEALKESTSLSYKEQTEKERSHKDQSHKERSYKNPKTSDIPFSGADKKDRLFHEKRESGMPGGSGRPDSLKYKYKRKKGTILWTIN